MSKYHHMTRLAGEFVDEVGEFWVVTAPTGQSELIDILFKRTVPGIGLQFKGGLNAEDIIGVFTDEARAREFAIRQLP